MASAYAQIVAPPLLIMTISVLLSGIMISQVYYYASKYHQDPRWTKFITYTVCIMEIAHCGAMLHVQYFYIVASGQNRALMISWSFGVATALGIAAACLVQGFYVYRIWQFSHNRYAVLLLSVLLFCRLGFGIATVVLTFVFKNVTDFLSKPAIRSVVNTGLALSVCVDIFTPAAFIYSLRLRQTQVKRTKTLMRKLVFYTVNTGAIAIVFSAATLVAFNLPSAGLVYTGFIAAFGQVYANTMMALLNARRKLKSSASGAVHSLPLQTMGRVDFEGGGVPANIVIGISKETETTSDSPASRGKTLDTSEADSSETALYSLA